MNCEVYKEYQLETLREAARREARKIADKIKREKALADAEKLQLEKRD